jgi:hypothetical protein
LDALDLDHVDPGADDHVDYKATTFASRTGRFPPNHCFKVGQRRLTPVQIALSCVPTDMTCV